MLQRLCRMKGMLCHAGSVVLLATFYCVSVVCQQGYTSSSNRLPFPAALDATAGAEQHAICLAIQNVMEVGSTTFDAPTAQTLAKKTLDDGGVICVAQAPYTIANNNIRTQWTTVLSGLDFAAKTLCDKNCPLQTAAGLESYVGVNEWITTGNKDMYTVRWACLDKSSYDAHARSCGEQVRTDASAVFPDWLQRQQNIMNNAQKSFKMSGSGDSSSRCSMFAMQSMLLCIVFIFLT